MAVELDDVTADPARASAAGGRGATVPPGYAGPRGCGPMDLAPTVDLVDLVFNWTSSPPARPAFGGEFAHAYNARNLENVRVVWHRGHPVATVAVTYTQVRTPRGTLRVADVGGVATHPDHRKLGLARLLLEDAHAKLRADGVHVGLLGTVIPDFYRQLGWEYAGRRWTFTLDRGNVAFLPEPTDLAVDEDWRGDAAALCALYHAGPMGAERTIEAFTQLAERRLDRVFVGRRRGHPVAYAGMRGQAVREHAGAPEDVAALLRAVYAALDDPTRATTGRPTGQAPSTRFELTIFAPPLATGLPALLHRLGFPHTFSNLGMLKILDPPGLLAAVGIADVALAPVDSGEWEVRHAGARLRLNERALTKLVFGPERFPGFADRTFPIDFYQWWLDRL